MKKDFLHTNKDGFKLPENYFEKFEENLFQQLKEGKETELPEAGNFKVPEGYFEDVELKIMAAVAPAPKAKGKVISFITKYKNSISSIAAIVLVAFMAVTIFNSDKEDTIEHSVAASDVISYFEEGYGTVTTYEIGEIFSDEINELPLTASLVDEDAVIEYLSGYNVTQYEQDY